MAKKKVATRRVSNKSAEPKWDDMDSITPEEFGRRKHQAFEFYRLEYKSADYKKWVIDYVSQNDKWKEHKKAIAKSADARFNGTLGSICRMRLKGMPDLHEPYKKHWEGLPGTMGELKPVSEFIDKELQIMLDRGEQLVEAEVEQKKEEEKQSEVYKPTIQERIAQVSSSMCEPIEEAFDNFISGKITDFKGVKLANLLRERGCKQPHARLIKSWYDPYIEEYNELLNPPDTSKMSEHDKDMHQQLKEGYNHYTKAQIKKLYEFSLSIQGACDAMITEAKASRKPRKVSKKAPEQIVSKLKYKLSDEKYNVSSVEAHKLVGANCLVVFNSKNRKLGIYYTSVEDPQGAGREGSGLTVKGQTLQRFDEEKSVWYTLRKPIDQLQEIKSLNTRRKFENWIEKLTTTPTKMNGRINLETVLIGVYK